MAILVFLFIFLVFGEISSKHSAKLSKAVRTFKGGKHMLMSKQLSWRAHKPPPTVTPTRVLSDWVVIGHTDPRMKYFVNTDLKPFLMVKK